MRLPIGEAFCTARALVSSDLVLDSSERISKGDLRLGNARLSR